MGMLGVFRIAGSALTAQRLRMDVIASNIANSEATATSEGGPYKREQVIFSPIQARQTSSSSLQTFATGGARRSAQSAGVEVSGVVTDDSDPRQVYDPSHPDADEEGYVAYPNVDMVTEMTDMLSASRAYEASITVLNVAKNMAQRALDLGRL